MEDERIQVAIRIRPIADSSSSDKRIIEKVTPNTLRLTNGVEYAFDYVFSEQTSQVCLLLTRNGFLKTATSFHYESLRVK